MKKIQILDISLCIAQEQKKTLTFREKLNIAAAVDAYGVDSMVLPALVNDKENAVIYRTIASNVKNASVAVSVSDIQEIEKAWDTVKDASSAYIQVVVPVSTVQMEYQYHLKNTKMLDKIKSLLTEAKKVSDRVELVCKDASRAEEGFVEECAKLCKECGGVAVTVCDDAGVYFPEDFAKIVKNIKAVCDIQVFVKPSDSLKMAASCAVEAIKAGADGVKCAVNGDVLAADVLADIFRAKGHELGVMCGLDSTRIHKAVSDITAENILKAEPVADEYAIDGLTPESTIDEVSKAAADLGYELSSEDNGNVYEEFKRVCAKRGTIGARELEAIIATSAMQVPSTYHLVNYVVNNGNIITATASITLEKNGEKFSGVSTGDGPIDASFHAIEQIIGHIYELDDFQVQSVTKGREAVGTALIRLRAKGKLYSGNGVSTDIIGACIRAYVNALNKIIYEEN